jgi:signal transduction histidine kinase
MLITSLLLVVLPVVLMYARMKRCETAFAAFLLEPDEHNEHFLSKKAPASSRLFISQLGKVLRENRALENENSIQLGEYQHYIEGWAHEIKTPLALMTLMLDNRSAEMSVFVSQRMQHVHDRVQLDVEQILYFGRLGAVHKDYHLEPLNLLEVCHAAVEDNLSLLDEADFVIEVDGDDSSVMTDQKGLLFILSQIISNSVKYVGDTGVLTRQPLLRFAVSNVPDTDTVVLGISDNGPGVQPADLPFIFDKGFTGIHNHRLEHTTGMGLFLVRKMAADLAIELDASSQPGCGLTIELRFPRI